MKNRKIYLIYEASGKKLPVFAGDIYEVSEFLKRNPKCVRTAIHRHTIDKKSNCYIIDPAKKYKDKDEK